MKFIKSLLAGCAIAAMIGSAQAQTPPQRGPMMMYATGAFQGAGLIFQASLTPTATAAAIATVQQTFAMVGLLTTDVLLVLGPAPTSLCPNVSARVSAADTLQLSFSVLTAAACTPAPGTYTVVAIR